MLLIKALLNNKHAKTIIVSYDQLHSYLSKIAEVKEQAAIIIISSKVGKLFDRKSIIGLLPCTVLNLREFMHVRLTVV